MLHAEISLTGPVAGSPAEGSGGLARSVLWHDAAEAAESRTDARTARKTIVQVHEESRRRYGRRHVTHALHAHGWCANAKRVRRVMREEGLRGVRKERFVPRTIDSARIKRTVAPNVLQTRVSVDGAVCAWASDIPYVATREDWLYLAVILALKTRQGLGLLPLGSHAR